VGDLEKSGESGITVDESGGEEGRDGDHGSGGQVPDNAERRGGPAVPGPPIPELRVFH